MRTRPDAQQEALARRLALIRAAEPAERSAASSEDDWWAGHTAVAGWSSEEDAEPPVPVFSAVPVPEPGRHAARRPRWLAPPLPEVLRGRTRLGATQLAVVALALAAALALTCWWLARGRATVLAPVSAPAAPTAAASPLVAMATPVGASGAPTGVGTAGPSAATGSAGAMVTVDVEGKVRRPGIVILTVGSRVTDALHAAGGVPHRRSLGGLNLAAVLVDGQQIVVGGAPVASSGTGTTTGGTGTMPDAGTGTLVNLNTATAEELDTLPDIGPVTAQSILEWRQQNGGFTSVQELLEVDGIGPATLEKLTPHVTV